MAKDRATIGIDGRPLPILPPERDVRVWARLVRIMFYLPGFMGLLLIKAGEPASFGITVELLMCPAQPPSSADCILARNPRVRVPILRRRSAPGAGPWSLNCSPWCHS
jgi:hypothetical protein